MWQPVDGALTQYCCWYCVYDNVYDTVYDNVYDTGPKTRKTNWTLIYKYDVNCTHIGKIIIGTLFKTYYSTNGSTNVITNIKYNYIGFTQIGQIGKIDNIHFYAYYASTAPSDLLTAMTINRANLIVIHTLRPHISRLIPKNKTIWLFHVAVQIGDMGGYDLYTMYFLWHSKTKNKN